MSDKQQYRQARFTRPPGACEIILVRHGESQPADPDRPFPLVDGHGDPPLHEPDGVEQAERACRRLIESGEDFAAVYVTTLQRTHQTARVLLDHLGVEPVVEPDLREVFLGDWEGGEFRKRAADRRPDHDRDVVEGDLGGAAGRREVGRLRRRGSEPASSGSPGPIPIGRLRCSPTAGSSARS